MFALSSIYHPITSQPFNNDETYIEITPCKGLMPYICCFWGTYKPYIKTASSMINPGLVTPDTCMDVIFDMDMDKNELYDMFCGINDTSFYTQSQKNSYTSSCFAIRFYFWAVQLFSDETMNKSLNTFVETDAFFKNLRRDFQKILLDSPLMIDRVSKAEQYLLKKLNLNKQNNNVMNAVYKLLTSKGTASISDISEFTAISQRQLERLFLEHVGVSPKKLSGLIRYQYLWQEILSNSHFNMQDSVFKYGYTDQAHLLKDFKKYHTMTPSEARAFAYNTK